MSVKANGTDAKEIALHFLKQTGVERATSAIIGRSIIQAKKILEAGYSKTEIIESIDHIVNKGVQMYSIGYVSVAINETLQEIERKKLAQIGASVREEQEKSQAEIRGAVENDEQSAERNTGKAKQFGVQSRVRKKFNFDMFEEE